MHVLLILAFLIGSTAAHASPCPEPHIQAHLASVERELLSADVSKLTPAQLERRNHHIAVLADYREQCLFPQNHQYPDRLVTIFVDDHGTHCAVGHLMAEDGEDALVRLIRDTRNTATIWELADDREIGPVVQQWLVDNGLSLYEAARIQPSYCWQSQAGSCLCGWNIHNPYKDVSGIAEGAIVSVNEDEQTVEVEVDLVNGVGAAVGDVKMTGWVEGDVVGRRALVVVHAVEGDARTFFSRGASRRGEEVECTTRGQMNDGSYCATIDYDVYVEALFSEDCMARVVAEDPVLGQSTCDLGGAACGVSVEAETSPEPTVESIESAAETTVPAVEIPSVTEPVAAENVVSGDGCIGGPSTIMALVALALLRRRR